MIVLLAGYIGYAGAQKAIECFLPSGAIEMEGTISAISLLATDQYYFHGKLQGKPVRLLIKEKRGVGVLETNGVSLAGKGARIIGQLETVSESTNPKGFNYKNHLIGKGCQGSVSITSLTLVPSLDSKQEQMRVAIGRRWVKAVYESTAWQQGDLAIGILLGEDERIDEAVRSDYQLTGTTHILTVSGVHFGILILCVNAFLNRLEISYRLRKGVLLFLVTFMLWIIGWDTAACRAFWMLIVIETAMMGFAQPDPLEALSWTAVLLMLQTPGILPNASFQLSMAALMGLIVVYPMLYPRRRVVQWLEGDVQTRANTSLSRWQKYLKSLLLSLEKHVVAPLFASLSVLVTMAPLLIYAFNSLSLFSLLYNIPVAWFSACALPLLALMGPLSIYPPLALAAGIPTGILLKLMSLCVATAKGWQWLPVPLSSLSLGASCLALAALGILLGIKQNRKVYQKRRAGLIAAMLIGMMICLSLQTTPPQSPFAEVYFFDVGQGDGALFKLQNGRTLVVDTGKQKKRGGIEELLLKSGVKHVDTLIITHFHEDHMGQYEQLFQKITIDRIGIFSKGVGGQSALCQQFIQAAKGKAIEIVELHAGKNIGDFQTVWPPEGFQSSDLNDESLVGVVTIGKIKFLMTGDMTSKVEYDIMRRVSEQVALEKTQMKWVVKVPHHGSKHSSSKPLTALEGLTSAVVSVGPNFYRHPAKKVIDQYGHRLKEDFFRTDRQGYVHYMTDGVKLYVNQKGGSHGISRYYQSD